MGKPPREKLQIQEGILTKYYIPFYPIHKYSWIILTTYVQTYNKDFLTNLGLINKEDHFTISTIN